MSTARWQLPQFSIGDKVKVDQKRAPDDWRADWEGIILHVVGIVPASKTPSGRLTGWEYWLSETPNARSRGTSWMDGPSTIWRQQGKRHE